MIQFHVDLRRHSVVDVDPDSQAHSFGIGGEPEVPQAAWAFGLEDTYFLAASMNVAVRSLPMWLEFHRKFDHRDRRIA